MTMILYDPIHITDQFVYVDPSGDAVSITVNDIYIEAGECKVSVTFEDLQDAQQTCRVYPLARFLDRISDPHTSRAAQNIEQRQ